MSEAIERFRVGIPQDDIDELHRRIDGCRWPDALPGVGWDYGVDPGYLRELAEYWRDGFDWRAQEDRLNAFPQFRTEIDGQNVHFAHVRSPRPDAVPLLLGQTNFFDEFDVCFFRSRAEFEVRPKP